MEKGSKKAQIVKKFVKLCEKLNRVPTLPELKKETGVTRDMVQHHFGGLNALLEESRKLFPKAFKNSMQDVFNDKNVNKIKNEVKSYQRFVITSAVVGCKVNKDFMACINTYCDARDAKLLVLLSSDPAAKVTNSGFIDNAIPREAIVASNLSLNSNIHISTIKLSSKQIDPITGLSRLGQRNGSFIYASPKQRLKMVAVANNKCPHAIMTTGAITTPDYSTDKYMSERTAHIAAHDHIMGGIIVEIVDNNEFHFRQIQYIDGGFIDLGLEYKANDVVVEADTAAFVLGDVHVGDTDPAAMAAWKEVITVIQPEFTVIHDIFNGRSINPHEADNIVERSKAVSDGVSLYSETAMVAEFLEDLNDLCHHIVIAKSNHDAWLDTYLNKALYAKDSQNHGFALKLANALVNEEKDPLQYAVELHVPWLTGCVRWLKRDEDFKIAGCQLSAHGDAGSNGARGSTISMENAYGNSITGHSHTPELLRGAMVVGTSTHLKLSYNKGASSWLQSSAILYGNGSKQLINCFDGKWRLED